MVKNQSGTKVSVVATDIQLVDSVYHGIMVGAKPI